MADAKITALTDLATLDNADIVPVVDDVAGTPVTKKFTFTTLKAFLKTYFDTLYSPGGIIASTQYNHTGLSSYAVTSTSFVDLDATNLSVTFTAPASGNVIVKLGCSSLDLTAGKACYFNLRTGSTDITGTNFNVAYAPSGVKIDGATIAYSVKITGLTPGASYTYKWGVAVQSGATATIWHGYGTGLTTNGFLLMEVHSA